MSLKRLSKREADKIAAYCGYRDAQSMVRVMVNGGRCTSAAIRDEVAAVSSAIRDIDLVEHTGHVVVCIRLRWWSWLALGLVHWRVRQKAMAAMQDVCAANVSYNVHVR